MVDVTSQDTVGPADERRHPTEVDADVVLKDTSGTDVTSTHGPSRPPSNPSGPR